MSRMERVLREMRTARLYTEELLKDVEGEDWFRQPAEGVTHLAWQMGHLAFAEYRLALERIRGAKPEDEEVISEDFLKLFGKGSNPEEIASKYPEVEAIREVFKGVHRRTVKELKEVPEEVLDEPAGRPHPMFTTKLGALEWCLHHEYVHAGQIGLLRRLLGKEPLR